MKLLLIEDEDFIRDLYKRQLELAGMPTDAFGLGNDGLNAAHQNPTAYDLVLLDIMLPDTNGLQILKDLKQNNATKHIPVILLTNLSQDMLIKEGFELGAEGYLVKAAYTPAQIVQEVKNILAKKGAPAVSPQSPQVPSTPATPAPAAGTPAQTPASTPTPDMSSTPVTSPNPAPTTPPAPAADPMSPTPAMPSTDTPQAPTPSMPDPMTPQTPATPPSVAPSDPATTPAPTPSDPAAPVDPSAPAPTSATSTDLNNSH